MRGEPPVGSVMHTRRRAASVRRMSESFKSAVAMEREATATSTEPGSTPWAAQSSSQLMSLGVTDAMPRSASSPSKTPSMPREKSAATTRCPAAPSGIDSAPVPQPMSSTDSPGRMAASFRNRST